MPTEIVKSETGKMIFARLNEDEDLLEALLHVAKGNNISAGFFLLVGTLKKAKVGFFRKGKYETIRIDEPLEIVSCMGNVSVKENKLFVHAHIYVSNEKGEVMGGHLMSGCTIAAAGELALIEAVNVKLFRKLDEKTQLFLWSIEK